MPTKAIAPGPARELVVRVAHGARPLSREALWTALRRFLDRGLRLRSYALAFHFVDAVTMEDMNRSYLRHAGPTDVLTFDHRDAGSTDLYGEVYVCVAVAVDQAPRYGTTWQSEVVRYALHGVLHLQGWDDQSPAARRRMRREEDRWMRWLEEDDDSGFSSLSRRGSD